MAITQQQLDKIAELTDDNAHGEALQYIAKIVGHKILEKILKHINELHKLEGSMPTDLRTYRNRQRDELFGYIKSDLGEDTFTLIYSQL